MTERVGADGRSVHYVRDALGKLVEQRAGGSVTTYAYAPTGLLERAANEAADIRYERDALGRVLAETCNGRPLAFTYDPKGRRTSRVTPAGVRSAWSYDANSQPVVADIAGHRMAFAHDAAGREVERRLGGAAVLTHEWDANHRLLAQALSVRGDTTGTVQRRGYTYDAGSRVTAVSEPVSGTRRFGLDAHGRVTTVSAADWSETYAYDEHGNLSRATYPSAGGADQRAAVVEDELTHAGTRVLGRRGTRYEHDASGRVVRRIRKLLSGGSRVWRYVWDARDRLSEVVTPDGSRWRYAYDPFGRRVAKERLTADGAVAERTDFTWDGMRLVEETHARSDAPERTSRTWDFRAGTHTPIAQTVRTVDPGMSQREVDERFHAIVTDLVGSPAELVGEDGTIAWRRRATLWGLPLDAPPAGGPDCPLRFPGQYFDAETGLHYNVERYYEPETAGYLTPDPLGLEPAPNNYRYVDNPLTWADPLGLAPCLVGTRVDYNRDPLSSAAFQARFDAHGRWTFSADRNVAVARVEGHDDLIIGFSQGGGYHSEHHILDQLQELGISPDRITHLYSERQICPDICQPMLSNVPLRDDLQVTYSVPWFTNQTGDGRFLNGQSQMLLNQMIRDNGGVAFDRS